MGYEVINSEKETLIKWDGVALKVYAGNAVVGTPFLLGHLYAERRSFVPVKTYVFEITNGCTDVELAKKAMDFFFASLLDTELYVKEVPRESALFVWEAERLYGKEMTEEQYGAVSVVRGSGTK